MAKMLCGMREKRGVGEERGRGWGGGGLLIGMWTKKVERVGHVLRAIGSGEIDGTR
jgi:hypothetical protein